MPIGRDGGEASDDWATPDWLYNQLDAEFNFDFDPCPLNYTVDGLTIPWKKANFVNPPYGKGEATCRDDCEKKTCRDRGYHISERVAGKDDFIRKAYEEFLLGRTSVLLIPAATGTESFHTYIWDTEKNCPLPGREVRFLKGRIAFKGTNTKGEYTETKKGKHDSMIVVFRGHPEHR